MRTVAATVGIVIGLSLGIFAWMYLAGEATRRSPRPRRYRRKGWWRILRLRVEVPTVSEEPKASAPIALATFKTTKAPQEDLTISGTPGTRLSIRRHSFDRCSPGARCSSIVGTRAPTPVRLHESSRRLTFVWVESEGYRRWTRVVTVPSDRVTRSRSDVELGGRVAARDEVSYRAS